MTKDNLYFKDTKNKISDTYVASWVKLKLTDNQSEYNYFKLRQEAKKNAI